MSHYENYIFSKQPNTLLRNFLQLLSKHVNIEHSNFIRTLFHQHMVSNIKNREYTTESKLR